MLEDLLCCPQPRPTKSENCAWGHAPCSRASTIKVMAPWPNYVSRRTCVQSQIVSENSCIQGGALLMAFTAWTEPALARSYLNCLAKKVVIVDTPRGSTSSNVEKHLGFWIDEPSAWFRVGLISSKLSRL